MPPPRALRAALLAALSLALPAAARSKPDCSAGEVKAHGKCVKECPSSGAFGQPDECECAAGFGKILLGNGNGQCEPLRCPTGAVIAVDRKCECAAGYEKAPLGKRKVRCEARNPAR